MQPALNVATAFSAGLVSFVSPCVLPLIPAYLSFLTGSSLQELREDSEHARRRVVMHACMFALGFSSIFISAGLLAGSIGSALGHDRVVLARVGGVLIVLFGLNMIGVLRINMLFADKRLRIATVRRSFAASFCIGIGFAAGWSPCIGPILASILLLASTQATADAAILLTAYSLGLALPLLATAYGLSTALPLLARIRPALHAVEIVAGVVMILGGLVLVYRKLQSNCRTLCPSASDQSLRRRVASRHSGSSVRIFASLRFFVSTIFLKGTHSVQPAATPRITGIYLWLTALLVVGFDQWSKSWVLRALADGSIKTIVPHLLDFIFVRNTHGAYGLFGNQPWFLISISFVAFVIIYLSFRERANHSLLVATSLGLVLGGAVET